MNDRVRTSILAATLLLAAMALCSERALAIAPHHSDCLPKGVQTVAKDSVARIFAVKARLTPSMGVRVNRILYACLFRRGIAVRLPLGASNVALAGTIAAYSDTTGGIDYFSTEVVELDLSSGRILFSLPATTGVGTPEGLVFVKSLVITPLASVAWIGSKFSLFTHAPTIYEVRTASASGATTMLDQGASIVPSSLRLARGNISWTSGNTVRSAPLR
jgi:hypothetical protein